MEDAYLGQIQDIILGQDFLTWLWFRSETGKGAFATAENEPFYLYMEQRISVQGGEGDSKETTSVSGLLSELREAKMGLSMGKKVTKALVRIEVDPDAWQVTLKAEDFSLGSLKTPKIETRREDGEDPDAAFLEKMYLIERLTGFVDVVYAQFLELRFSSAWDGECSRIRDWLGEG